MQKFVDDEARKKTIMSNLIDPPQLINFFHPSQLEERFGGTAPNVTRYWPPHMPEYLEKEENTYTTYVPREEYRKLYTENPGLTLMPKRYRMDMAPFPQDPVVEE